jgi:uncharacterized alkaline shock family protein YloU
VSDQLVLTEPEGTITVPAATLAQLVVRALERVEGAKVGRPRRSVDVEVTAEAATVAVRVAATYGAVLPELAEAVQKEVAAALEQMCRLESRRVDVAIEELVET